MRTHLSLFSGIGGLDLAAEWAGFKTVGQCEFADFPFKVLSKYWPDVQKWRDIRSLTGSDFYKRTGLQTVDVLSGGFPCQPFSVAGKRRGKSDDRYLWPQMLRVISEIRPTWIIGENVAGLVSMAEPIGASYVESRAINRFADEDYYDAVSVQQEHMLLEGILQDIENAGYEVQPFIIPACGVGAPHRRERIFIVGWNTRSGERESQCQIGKVSQQDTKSGGICENVADAAGERCGEKGQHCERTAKWTSRSGIMADAKYKHFDWGGDSWGRRDESANSCSDVSNTQCSGRSGLERRRSAQQFENISKALADYDGERIQRWEKTRYTGGFRSDGKKFSVGCIADWWSAEPDVGRVANGVSNRVDRLRSLGNAVVPEQAYPIFKAIAEIEKGMFYA